MAVFDQQNDLDRLREGGRRLAEILELLAAEVMPGVSTTALNDRAEALIREQGDIPAFLNYSPEGASRPYPAALCVSINDEIVHGIPNEMPKILKEGDIVSLDLGLIHGGLITDAAVTVGVGKLDAKAVVLIDATREALAAGIAAARGGNTIGDIGNAIDAMAARRDFSIPYELGGHGVGRKVHEEPHVPNFGEPHEGALLVPGMVLALEPMLCEGEGRIREIGDGYTLSTADGSRSAHFEHTVLITEGEAEILTRTKK